MGKHDREHKGDGTWPKDKPLPTPGAPTRSRSPFRPTPRPGPSRPEPPKMPDFLRTTNDGDIDTANGG